jgi:nucleoside-triphosphatase THEP1
MKLAYTIAPEHGATNRLLASLAVDLAQQGFRLCGTVQHNTPRVKDHACDMDVKVLPDGPIIRISQSLGANARGCRLDPGALETTVSLANHALTKDADLLIVNKFGKHEAEGRGFRDTIATALSMGIPVLVGANTLNLEALQDFVDGMAEALAPEPKILRDWAMSNTRPSQSALLVPLAPRTAPLRASIPAAT